MPRRKLIRQNQHPYHVTSRTNHKDWFKIPIFKVWDLVKEALIYAQDRIQVDVHCFMLMGNHYHMLITTPGSNIDKFMMNFNRKLSQLINFESGVINHKFSNRYSWTIVDNGIYLENVYRYIYQNPVRANMTENCYSWPYSSLHFSSYESKIINHKPHLYYAREKSWIEQRFGEDFEKIVRLGLKKDYFRPRRLSSLHQQILERGRG